MNRKLFVPMVLALIAALPVYAAAQAPAPQAKASDPTLFLGDWTGTIDVAGVQLEIAIHFKLDEKKAVTATMDSITQGAMGLPLEGIKIDGRSATFLIAGIPGEPLFKGTLDETGKKLAGTFSQNGIEGTFQTVKSEK
jgi:hypothetical protein